MDKEKWSHSLAIAVYRKMVSCMRSPSFRADSTEFPVYIVDKLCDVIHKHLKKLKEKGTFQGALAVCDVSGSMTWYENGTCSQCL